MPRKTIDVLRGLTNQGFRQSEGDHHYFTYFSLAGKKTAVFTKMSHSHKEIDVSLISLMARQCKVPKSSFENLVDCPLSQNDYEVMLVSSGHVAPPFDAEEK
jgi:hypothetical protein